MKDGLRQLLDWEWYGDTNMVRVFLHMLLTAREQAGFWRNTYVGRGCLLTSAPQLANETGLSLKQVRLVLKKLVDGREIVIMRARKKSLITICKYDSYSTPETEGGHEKGTNNGTIREETKKENRKEKESFPLKPPYKEKEKEKEKKDDLDDNAHAREIEKLKTWNQWAEGICKNHGIGYDRFLAAVDEFSLDMVCSDIDITKIDNLRAYFNRWLTNKKRQQNGQQTNQFFGQPRDPRVKLAQDAVKAMASLAAESRRPKDVPF